ncbi:MAG TPA: hypothetical protein VMV10_14425 [Pirellulales bacterium]|nr:hypothetical protein [Pirellulales bacterium]
MQVHLRTGGKVFEGSPSMTIYSYIATSNYDFSRRLATSREGIASYAAGVKRVPDHEQRKVMQWIVAKRLGGWGWRRISSAPTANRTVYKKPDRSAPRGYTLEFWDPQRCKRAFDEMMRIIAGEQAGAVNSP